MKNKYSKGPTQLSQAINKFYQCVSFIDFFLIWTKVGNIFNIDSNQLDYYSHPQGSIILLLEKMRIKILENYNPLRFITMEIDMKQL